MEIIISELNPRLKRTFLEDKAYGLLVLLCGHRHCQVTVAAQLWWNALSKY